ncbi:hypothetical protein HRI_000716700 [Hibiscus trionum]|uniref:Endonuclease/exonuclease/phosphatase domain-containing protein n=1 Tax=Hibiscus trionum TaxID=183268 RepID=A0A9W7LN13_HIBTR|nr:hypothetical protein HRI_000716700 [Hibiscus trionum]
MDLSIISWNIRGMGKMEKLGAIRRLMVTEKPKILFLQETNLSTFIPAVYRGMGCGSRLGKIFSPAVGASGGLLTIWDLDFFSVIESFFLRRFIAIIGRFRGG